MGAFGLQGVVTFLPEKFTQWPNAWLLKSGCKCIQIVWKTKTFTIPTSNETTIPCGIKLSQEFNFADFGFFKFCGNKFLQIWISNFTPGNIFSQMSCVVLESDKNGSHIVILRCLQPISLKFSNVNKRSIFLRNFFGGSLFSWDLIFADWWEIRENIDPTKISCHSVIPKTVIYNSLNLSKI